jgi:hypothetical protein
MAMILYNACLRSIWLMRKNHILQLLSKLPNRDQRSISFTEKLLSKSLVFKYRHSSSKFVNIHICQRQIIQHVLKSFFVKNIVFFFVNNFKPLLVFNLLSFSHFIAPPFEAFCDFFLKFLRIRAFR